MYEKMFVYKPNEYLKADIVKIKRTPIHFHLDSVQIVLVLKGTLFVKRAFEISKVHEGELTFINKNDVYAMWSDDGNCIAEILALNIGKLKSSFEVLDNIAFRNNSMKGKELKVREIDEVRKRTFQRYLIEILSLLNEDKPNESRFNEILVQMISLAIYEYNCLYYVWPDVRYISNKKIERFHRIVSFVKDNLSQNFSLDDMAEKEQVGKTYFTQMWKELMDLPFGEYVNYERVLYSERPLLFTDKNMINISEECGFSDVKYYYKNFKFWYGKKPGEWKKDWSAFLNCELDMENLDFTEAKHILDEFYEKYLANTNINTRIYEQYLMLKETAFPAEILSNIRVSFDLFFPQNLSGQENGEFSLPEYSAIGLFFKQIYEMGLELQIQVRTEALKVQAYREAFHFILEKSERYFGLKYMKNWEFQFICKSPEEVYEAEFFGNIIMEKLNGGKVKYILI